ncbi:histidine kinase, partial [Burkholderia multivorans]
MIDHSPTRSLSGQGPAAPTGPGQTRIPALALTLT